MRIRIAFHKNKATVFDSNHMLAELRKHLTGMLGRAAPAASPNVSVKSSEIARDRLAIILAHQRSSTRTTDVLNGVDMKLLQRDLLDCVKVTFKISTPFLFHPPHLLLLLCRGTSEKRTNHQFRYQ